MTRQEIETKVIQEYNNKYANWTNIEITRVIPDILGGTWAVVRAIENGHITEGEICFVSYDGIVQIFETTNELAMQVEKQNSLSQNWKGILLSRSGLISLLLICSILGLIILGISNREDNNVKYTILYIIGAVITSATGYLFGKSERL